MNGMGQRNYLYHGRILNLAIEDDKFEIVEHKPAVAVLAVQNGKALFVRQFRPAIGHYTLEIPAGLIEPGEDPQQAAQRELAEETQLSGPVEFLTSFYLSPGFCDELVYLYRATQLTPQSATPDDDEQIEVEWHPVAQVLEQIKQGQIVVSGATAVGLHWHMAFGRE